MNTNIKIHFAVFLALVVVMFNAFTVMAYPAGDADRLPDAKMCQSAVEAAAEVDIPATRTDYQRLEQAEGCVAVAGVHISIPVTGYVANMIDSYEAMKDRQAEYMDRSGYPSRQEIDQRFMDFKARQAERKIP